MWSSSTNYFQCRAHRGSGICSECWCVKRRADALEGERIKPSSMDGFEYQNYWLCTLSDWKESSRRLTTLSKHFRLLTDCSPQGSNRTNFSSSMTILHQSKHNLNTIIVNPALQRLSYSTQLKSNKFPTLTVFLGLYVQKEFWNMLTLKCWVAIYPLRTDTN